MQFKIHAVDLSGNEGVFFYDNVSNTLSTEAGSVFQNGNHSHSHPDVTPFSKDAPLSKSRDIRILKIQLGLSCNYSCDYCSQRFVERAPETSKKDIDAFLAKLDNLNLNEKHGRLKVEFWGGEPLVYYKTLRPLAEALADRFRDWESKPQFSIITNGSILNDEINQWLYDNDFTVCISHDAMGQSVRGPDPLEDEKKRKAILDLYKMLAPKNRISFNSMLTAGNYSRKAIRDYFVELTGDEHVQLGEGALIDAYDDGGYANALQTKQQHFQFRQTAFNDILSNGTGINNWGVLQKIDTFTNDVLSHHSSKGLGQKCGMDREDVIAVDLRGNVITCQNVSAVETAMNGESHLAGTLDDFDNVKVKSATHWSNRADCAACPVLHLCRGACMFLEDKYWDISCRNAYSDNVALFALSFHAMTGFVPVHIIGEGLPLDRADIWGTLFEHKEEPVARPFPVKVVVSKEVVDGVEVFSKSAVEELKHE